MRKVGLTEAKRRLAELVECVERGEKIGITKHKKLIAVIRPAADDADANLDKLFEGMERVRRRAKPLRGTSVVGLIREGRR
jgi:prevent-host-death family protein